MGRYIAISSDEENSVARMCDILTQLFPSMKITVDSVDGCDGRGHEIVFKMFMDMESVSYDGEIRVPGEQRRQIDVSRMGDAFFESMAGDIVLTLFKKAVSECKKKL